MVQRISDKIKVVSFIATIFVVYRHSLNFLAFFGTWKGMGYSAWVQNGFMTLTQIAVPYFFLISGFFFFKRSYYEGFLCGHIEDSSWLKMLYVKFRTLFIPFIFWNVVGLLVLVITKQEYKLDIISFLNSDWYGPLWYVRDLMTLMFVVPLYQWIFNIEEMSNREIGIFKYVLPLGVLGVLYYYWIPVDTIFISSEGILFFFIGGLLRKKDNLLSKRISSKVLFALLVVWLLWSFSICKIRTYHGVYIFTGILLLWNLIDFFPSKLFNKILQYSDYSFLIYVTHFYMIKIFKVVLGRLFYENEMISLLSYICLPILCVTIIICIGKIMQRHMPNLYAFTMGGRI